MCRIGTVRGAGQERCGRGALAGARGRAVSGALLVRRAGWEWGLALGVGWEESGALLEVGGGGEEPRRAALAARAPIYEGREN